MIAVMFLLLTGLSEAGTICNDGTQSPSCSVCSAGCCSYHGGCSGYSAPPRSYPSYPPAHVPARVVAWGLSDGVTDDGSLVIHRSFKEEGSVFFGYACFADTGGWVGASVSLILDPPAGRAWSPKTEWTPSTDSGGGSVMVNLVSGNSITRILSWSWQVTSGGNFLLSKVTGGMHSYAGESPLNVEELKRFSTADFVQVRVGEEVYRLSLQGSQAAIAAADAACTR